MATGKLRPASESQLAAELREAIGVGPDDDVTVQTPQFEREPGAPIPASAPDDADAWDALLNMDMTALKEVGLRAWDEPDAKGNVLMLFPGEWYARIPTGFPIANIFGKRAKFTPGDTSNDIRYGVLAYGIEVQAGKLERTVPCAQCGKPLEGDHDCMDDRGDNAASKGESDA